MLNPFTERRKKKEEELKEKIAAHQQQQVMMSQQQSPEMLSEMPSLPQFDAGDSQAATDAYAAEDFSKYLPASAQVDQAAPTWSGGGATYAPPSRARQCLGKLQSGFMIGASLGGAFGARGLSPKSFERFLYGTYAAIKFKHVLYLPIAVIQAGGAFGFFLSCGTVIRCEEKLEDGLHPQGQSPQSLKQNN